ncbi:class I SAM-dependent methyltransferase [Sediminitomix flava]|uniref:Methyltransferase family protein n=1 Tax=Sediminitomix flava TaxID=379075 RepID=A0A315ZHE0_SEDFL|nr:class I SAM-dependent methyltransferase [Sediminitomix flava]PWJ44570.1 methyltransferase family protein [Sediminitomix flava]
MTELDLLIDLHKNTDRQGPGSENDTLKALDFIPISGNKDLVVADIGCGSGGQSITLAQNIDAQITAVDLFPQFLDELNKNAQRLGLQEKITTLEKSMDDLPFEKESIDIIWSEGAIYNMGFEKGIKKWKEYLKPQGYLAVSEITWITSNRPKEVDEFWNEAYPEIDIASNKIKILEENGYNLVGYFYLEEDSWIKNYYKLLEDKFDSFLTEHKHSETAQNVVENYKSEIELYRKFKAYYSYGFYVARKE